MKRKKITVIILILLSCCCLVSVFICIFEYKSMGEGETVITQQPFPKITGLNAHKILADTSKEVDLIFWSEDLNQYITTANSLVQNSKEITRLQIYGNIKIIFPNASYLNQDDLQGCIVDDQTAYDLFGVENVIGNKIKYNNQEYYIRDVIESVVPIFIHENSSNDAIFENISFRISDKDMQLDVFLNKFNSTYGTNLKLIDREIVRKMVKVSLFLITGLLFVEVLELAGFRQKLVKKAKVKKNFLHYCIGIMIFIIILFYYINVRMEKLPIKWSDFSFWRDYLQDIRVSFVYQMQAPLRVPEIQFGISLTKYITFYIISCITNILLLLTVKEQTK